VAPRKPLKKILAPFIMAAAFLYFLLDLLFEIFLRPVNRCLARLRLFETITRAIEGLGPYTTLTLFLIPLFLLEPAKLVGVFLMASGHRVEGIAVLVGSVFLKILVVERIFQIGRPKLMTIPAFSWTYYYVVAWLDWLKAIPAWQAMRRQFRQFVQWGKSILRRSAR
jgi:hypothetical protein